MARQPLRLTRRPPAPSRPERRAPGEKSPPESAPETLRVGATEVRLIRSARRHKSVSARAVGANLVEVRAPANLPLDTLRPMLEDLIERIRRPRQAAVSDEALERRAQHWNRTLFGGALRWRSIRFVSNQRARLGSCSPAQGAIRLSERLKELPPFVLDYVIVHELAHLLEPNHSRAFWQLVARYPQAERARGFVLGWRYAELAQAGDEEEADDVTD